MAAPTIANTFQVVRRRTAATLGDNIYGTASGGSASTLTDTGDIDRFPTTPQYLLGAELSTIENTGSGQTRRITTHAKTGGTVTLTVSTWTAPDTTTTYEIHDIGGIGWEKEQYDNAIKNAVDSLADAYYTDTYNVYFGVEKHADPQGAPGWPRFEYPMPSGFNYIFGVDYLASPPRTFHPVAYMDTHRALGDATARTSLAQGFKVYEAGMYEWVSVAMNKVASPTDNLTVAIQTNSSGVPSGTVLTDGTSGTVTGSTLDERLRYVVFRFDPPVYLAANTTYHLVVDRTGAADSVNYYRLAEDTGNVYGDGTLSTFDNSTWTAVSGSDIGFAIFAASTLWIPLRHKSGWEYKRVGSDFIYLPHLPREGTPIRIRGGAAIAEPSAETDNIPVRSEYVVAYAIQELLANASGRRGSRDSAAQASAWAQHVMKSTPRPIRHLPPNAIQVFA